MPAKQEMGYVNIWLKDANIPRNATIKQVVSSQKYKQHPTLLSFFKKTKNQYNEYKIMIKSKQRKSMIVRQSSKITEMF